MSNIVPETSIVKVLISDKIRPTLAFLPFVTPCPPFVSGDSIVTSSGKKKRVMDENADHTNEGWGYVHATLPQTIQNRHFSVVHTVMVMVDLFGRFRCCWVFFQMLVSGLSDSAPCARDGSVVRRTDRTGVKVR